MGAGGRGDSGQLWGQGPHSPLCSSGSGIWDTGGRCAARSLPSSGGHLLEPRRTLGALRLRGLCRASLEGARVPASPGNPAAAPPSPAHLPMRPHPDTHSPPGRCAKCGLGAWSQEPPWWRGTRLPAPSGATGSTRKALSPCLQRRPAGAERQASGGQLLCLGPRGSWVPLWAMSDSCRKRPDPENQVSHPRPGLRLVPTRHEGSLASVPPETAVLGTEPRAHLQPRALQVQGPEVMAPRRLGTVAAARPVDTYPGEGGAWPGPVSSANPGRFPSAAQAGLSADPARGTLKAPGWQSRRCRLPGVQGAGQGEALLGRRAGGCPAGRRRSLHSRVWAAAPRCPSLARAFPAHPGHTVFLGPAPLLTASLAICVLAPEQDTPAPPLSSDPATCPAGTRECPRPSWLRSFWQEQARNTLQDVCFWRLAGATATTALSGGQLGADTRRPRSLVCSQRFPETTSLKLLKPVPSLKGKSLEY